MENLFYLGVLVLAKVFDNALNTTKTIMIQRSKWLLAGLSVVVSDFIYYWVIRRVVSADNNLAILTVAIAGGVGCAIACLISSFLSKDRTYVQVIMSDELEAMKELRDFLAEHHITNVATDSYTLDWDRKSISITAYPETKAEAKLISDYIESHSVKCKRVLK